MEKTLWPDADPFPCRIPSSRLTCRRKRRSWSAFSLMPGVPGCSILWRRPRGWGGRSCWPSVLPGPLETRNCSHARMVISYRVIRPRHRYLAGCRTFARPHRQRRAREPTPPGPTRPDNRQTSPRFLRSRQARDFSDGPRKVAHMGERLHTLPPLPA
jgi:hypothetical protein